MAPIRCTTTSSFQALEPKVARDQHLTIDSNTYDRSLTFTGGEHVVLGGTEEDDVLIAGLGDDTIWGDGGDDYIEGGHGINRLHCGTGYGGGGSGDILDLRGIDAIAGGGDSTFTFIGSIPFHALGQLRVTFANGTTIVEGNTTGDPAAELQIELAGHHNLIGSDFLL